MKRLFGVLFVALFAVFAPSCNIDEEFTTDVPVPLKVFEYTPAPGQFINDLVTSGFDGTQTSAVKAVAYAQNRLNNNLYVSLGGFGGYIVVGFDHDTFLPCPIRPSLVSFCPPLNTHPWPPSLAS